MERSLMVGIRKIDKFYTDYWKDKIKSKEYEHMPLKVKKSILEIQMATLEALTILPFNVESHLYIITQRCFNIISKLVKLQKSSKGAQSQTNEDAEICRLSLLQILLENAFEQY
jgi:hypothetical protein